MPLIEKFNRTYDPKYPVADAGYGSYNNYLYCEEHGMENITNMGGSKNCMNVNPAKDVRINKNAARKHKRLFRRGEKNVILELTLISCGFNLYKYHNKKQRQTKAA